MPRFAPVLALMAMACTPQSAELIDGEMVGYLASTTSFTLLKDDFDLTQAEENWNIDCRELDDEDIATLPDALDICGGQNWPPPHEVWLDQGSYEAFRMPLDVWRGEAIELAEGDIQIGLHHRVPGGKDFRFIFTIDPDFQPTRCTGNGTESELYDGSWLDGWSAEIDRLNEMDDLPPFLDNAAEQSEGGTLYFLNAFSFQWDPNGDDDTSRERWTLPEEFRSGYGLGTFIEENFHIRNNRFADPALLVLDEADIGGGVPVSSIFYGQCDEGDTIQDCQPWRDVRREARQTADRVRNSLARATPDGEAFYMPITHANEWRPHDGRAVGLDGWSEVIYSWVMLTPDSNPELGGNMHGYFSLVLDGDDSQSRLFVQGEFDVPKVKKERWGTIDLREQKLEDAGVELCQQ